MRSRQRNDNTKYQFRKSESLDNIDQLLQGRVRMSDHICSQKAVGSLCDLWLLSKESKGWPQRFSARPSRTLCAMYLPRSGCNLARCQIAPPPLRDSKRQHHFNVALCHVGFAAGREAQYLAHPPNLPSQRCEAQSAMPLRIRHNNTRSIPPGEVRQRKRLN
jgi:hypothetical protein